MAAYDPIQLTQELVRCQSVTPADGGALAHLAKILGRAGFDVIGIDRGGVSNLFARWGPKGHPRTFGFNGHTDVVPVGNAVGWRYPPFGATIAEGKIWGRGACDMKSGVAAFVSAATAFLGDARPDGALVIAITGDEEGDAVDGTAAILDWMAENGEAMSHCLVGEPTCPVSLGDAMKIGRRGSMTAWITATGKQGHTAYPQRARNAATALTKLVTRLADHELDQGTAHFEPSSLALTTIDTGNPATNVIPAIANATINIRFNDAHASAGLESWLRAQADAVTQTTNVGFEIRTRVSGESFVTEPGELSQLVSRAVFAETKRRPELSTSGGTSDARFIASHCPVVEFGLVGQSMHQVDEHVSIDDVTGLTAIYRRILEGYFT
ncbi:MAG: succinyl-diaminopimelate desuccinylase [Pseudomonadota bacterium]